jgi:hypothetical protein
MICSETTLSSLTTCRRKVFSLREEETWKNSFSSSLLFTKKLKRLNAISEGLMTTTAITFSYQKEHVF